MSHELKLHNAQTIILKELLFKPELRFSDLRKASGLDSDFFKFHIKKLVEIGYVSKRDNGAYSLTIPGKEFSNKIDTYAGVIERQPKSAVILYIVNKENEILVQKRLKHPYYGFWGLPGGKIKWGETITHAAARELEEETGVICEGLKYMGLYHEHVKSKETGNVLEDKIFHVVSGVSDSRNIKPGFEGGTNHWMDVGSFLDKKKKYNSCELEIKVGKGELQFIEEEQFYSELDF